MIMEKGVPQLVAAAAFGAAAYAALAALLKCRAAPPAPDAETDFDRAHALVGSCLGGAMQVGVFATDVNTPAIIH